MHFSTVCSVIDNDCTKILANTIFTLNLFYSKLLLIKQYLSACIELVITAVNLIFISQLRIIDHETGLILSATLSSHCQCIAKVFIKFINVASNAINTYHVVSCCIASLLAKIRCTPLVVIAFERARDASF